MNTPGPASQADTLPPGASYPLAFGSALIAILAFHAAYGTADGGGWWIVAVPLGLLPLALLGPGTRGQGTRGQTFPAAAEPKTRGQTFWAGFPTRTGGQTFLCRPAFPAGTWRQTFYPGVAAGLAMVAPRLEFFWGIFGPVAVLLWAVLAFWVGLALTLIRSVRLAWGNAAAMVLTPILWTGCEYFRSELYYLRFSWLNTGYALSGETASPWLPILGVYGVGSALWFAAAVTWLAPGWWKIAGPGLIAVLLAAPILPEWRARLSPSGAPGLTLEVAGAQVESTPPSELPVILDRLAREHPEAPLLVLPEYTLPGEPGDDLGDWCRTHRRYLVVGGKESRPEGGWLNTAFVIDASGEVVFRQAKSIPIQFFDDGIPAPGQVLWNSPWGPLGIAICYDLSYTRVMDRLVRLGARALIIPTMDSIDWGAAQHALHARVAPARAAEYGIPIVRVASSGVSQIVDGRGRVTASAPFDDKVATLGGVIAVGQAGRLPWDRTLAPACTGITGIAMAALLFRCRRRFLPQLPPLHTPSDTP